MNVRHLAAFAGVAGLLGTAGLAGWTATLESKGGSKITGSAEVEAATQATPDTTMPAPMSASYRASVTIMGAEAGAKLAWSVNQGGCDAVGPAVGSESAYRPITVDSRGSGSAGAQISGTLAQDGAYSVNVHSGEEASSEVAACGTLKSSGVTP